MYIHLHYTVGILYFINKRFFELLSTRIFLDTYIYI